jgi:hypothetical protein
MALEKHRRFSDLNLLFSQDVSPREKADILDSGFNWFKAVGDPGIWGGIHHRLKYMGDHCTEDLIKAFSKYPELAVFLLVKEEILWD